MSAGDVGCGFVTQAGTVLSTSPGGEYLTSRAGAAHQCWQVAHFPRPHAHGLFPLVDGSLRQYSRSVRCAARVVSPKSSTTASASSSRLRPIRPQASNESTLTSATS